VVVEPWGEVIVDGVLRAVTPTAERMPVPEGKHFVKIAHPHFPAVTREVLIEHGKTERLRVVLTPPDRKPSGAGK
jgi:hypothetical protein